MSHGKMTKRGKSYYLDSWNPEAKKYIVTCALCGKRGYSPAIEGVDFCDTLGNTPVYNELKKTLSKMEVDEWGRCAVCAKIQEEV